MQNHKSGFTLIELLVVIAIIGILASVVLVSLGSAQSKSRDATRAAQIKEVKKALELYNLENNGYPQQSPSAFIREITPLETYINPLPSDPIADGTYYYRYISGTANQYGIRVIFENEDYLGATSAADGGYGCKTGVNMSSSWWDDLPICEGL